MEAPATSGAVPVDTLCVELTATCPLRCRHCSVAAGPERIERHSLAAVMDWFAQVAPLESVFLSGGEPLRHPSIVDIARAADRAAREVVIYSSGVWPKSGTGVSAVPEALLAELREAGVDRIDLSIYSANAVEHDGVTGVRGSLEATLNSWTRARRAGLRVGVHFVPVVPGAAPFLGVCRLAIDRDAERLHVLAIADQGRALRARIPRPSGALLEALRAFSRRDCAPELVLSSQIRAALHEARTPRDNLHTMVIGFDSRIYPAEGLRRRQNSARSLLSPHAPLQPLLAEARSRTKC